MLNKFLDKDIAELEFRDEIDLELSNTLVMVQLSRDIKELIKAIRSLKCELDGDQQ